MADEAQGRDELRALAHPLRLRMLSLLTGVELSAAEVARELGTTQANASWHLRLLRDAGLLVDAGEVPGPGGRSRRYRYVAGDYQGPVDTAAGRAGSAAGYRAATRALAGELVHREAQREPAGPATLTDAELWVDPAEWADIVRRVATAAADLHAAARPPRTPGTVRVSATAVLFQMTGTPPPAHPDPTPDPDPDR